MRRVSRVVAARIGHLAAPRYSCHHLLGRAMASAAEAGDTVEGDQLDTPQAAFDGVVCLLDPRTILQREKLQELLSDKALYTSLRVPSTFLKSLSQGVMELGDMDDPMNSWHFGRKDEFFKYRLVGMHPTMSGFTCMIEQQQLAEICAGHESAGLPDWESFKADLQAGNLHFPSIRTPFLFAGTVLDAPAAAVYQLKQDGEVVGLAISSETVGG